MMVETKWVEMFQNGEILRRSAVLNYINMMVETKWVEMFQNGETLRRSAVGLNEDDG